MPRLFAVPQLWSTDGRSQNEMRPASEMPFDLRQCMGIHKLDAPHWRPPHLAPAAAAATQPYVQVFQGCTALETRRITADPRRPCLEAPTGATIGSPRLVAPAT